MTKPPKGGLSVWVILWVILKNAKNHLNWLFFNDSYWKKQPL